MRAIYLLMAVLTLIGPSSASAEVDSVVSDIAAKVMSEVDRSGDVWISVRARVRNSSLTERRVSVTLQAVDRDGFELKTVLVQGIVPAGQSDVLSNRTYMPYRDYQQIARWRQK